MPWIFLTLMLANVVYFGWNFISASQTPVRELSGPVVQEGKPIVLLSERKLEALPEQEIASANEPAEQQAVAQPVIGTPTQQCFNVGPFQSPASAEGFGGRMRGKGFLAKVGQRKAEGRDYWIYVPPFTNRAKAEERLRELKSKGVESFIVGEGAFMNAISLGHFSKKELAESFRDKLAAAGIVAEYREMANEGRVSWVYVAPGAAKGDLRAVVEGEVLSNTALRKEVAACEE
jgi:cell division protein FtsN